jgi:hypothetical protein
MNPAPEWLVRSQALYAWAAELRRSGHDILAARIQPAADVAMVIAVRGVEGAADLQRRAEERGQ